ncbi:chromosome segregation protein [Colletotrichum karsti]|uniref:Chromosome segregation protein n=1 Tax=Colletotrichum karsti TaxID=1095194 RepID=A0A9P6I006_9PEZI|nr:chromosome segregation protein [Colletotrichum karsti]KAF9874748.1 chromosome segregation protein [Colletotrichum karsti]
MAAFEGFVPAEFFTYEGRLGSFSENYPFPKRRASGATKGAKNLTWPHANYLFAEDLAKAGFVWKPWPDNPDNVVCFLCNKSLDGWEEGDNALVEHIKHSPSCGWAIVAGIEANVGDLAAEDPSSTRMIAARKATFGGRWPHENKRGWKCKTKQLAEAGWKYTPSLEYNDMATCTYCELALDGWEQGDKPMDEHRNRSPECPFFALKDQYSATKKTKGKAARGSKATNSRLSVQSVATAASDITSIADATAEVDDSVLTTASMASKKGTRAKKAPATKGRKTKAKKDEPVEVVETEMMEDEEVLPPPSKPARGRKRPSDEVDDSALTVSEAPAPKKRTARARAKGAADSSVIEQSQQDISIADAQPPAKAPKGRKTARASGTKGTRKASGTSLRSTASTASMRAAPGAFPEDEDEIQRQLEADLERPLTDDEDIMQDSDSERKKAPVEKPKTKKTRVRQDEAASPEHADSQMFDAEPYVANDEDVDEEFKQLEAEMTIDEPEVLEVPKKGRKAAGTRKVSKQTKAQKAKFEKAPEEEEEDELSMTVEPPAPAEPTQAEKPVDMEEDEISTATVITTTSKTARTSTGKKRGRPSKKSLEARASLEASKTEEVDMVEMEKARADPEPVAEPEVEHEELVEPEPEADAEPQPQPEAAVEVEVEEEAEEDEEEVDEADEVDEVSASQSFTSARQTPAPAQPEEKSDGPQEPEDDHEETEAEEEEPEEEPEPQAEPTPEKPKSKKTSIPLATSSPVVAAPARRSLRQQSGTPRISPAQSARQAAVSPSPSPQSSDAENQPPSSRSATAKKRVTHAVPSSTPVRPSSPTKRKVLASLQSTTPWNPVDIDLIFGSPEKSDKRNAVDRLLHKGTELTSPEKRMTVEEWIHFNANQAEERLRQECEAMVSKFENEGTKAMNVLEGLIVE